MTNKLGRFKYLSDYYISLLEAQEENNKKWIKYIKIWVENSKEFKTWKVQWADEIFNNKFKVIIDEMIIETEKELKKFFINL